MAIYVFPTHLLVQTMFWSAAKELLNLLLFRAMSNVDFADVHTVMANSGAAIMGSAQASGPERAITAIRQALNSPLLNNNEIKGQRMYY
jgi:cell division protein FtsZ